MKAVLLIEEMPTECIECQFCRVLADDKITETRCILTAKRNEDGVNTRAEWCPLRPLPQKLEVKVDTFDDIMHTEFQMTDVIADKLIANIRFETDKLVALGYNACLDEITGETE